MTNTTHTIALVTGGSRGLGRSAVLKLAERGVDAILTYKSNEAEAHAVVKQVEALGLEKALATPLREASLGQQRKTLLALALALPVKLLLLDEPFNALDATSARHLADTLTARAQQGGQVILLTSHVEPHVPVRDRWLLGG